MSKRVTLIGCVSKKASGAPARDLYNSELFRRRRAFAERSGRPWLILSALHGVVDPDTVLDPYDVTLKRMPKAARREWGRRVVSQLESRFGSLNGAEFEIHAGDEYVTAIATPLGERGASIVRPLQGLRIGEQLQWYDRQAGTEGP